MSEGASVLRAWALQSPADSSPWATCATCLLLSGAALGPLLAGLISPSGWNNVFYMLMCADACALLVSPLTPRPRGLSFPWTPAALGDGPTFSKWSRSKALSLSRLTEGRGKSRLTRHLSRGQGGSEAGNRSPWPCHLGGVACGANRGVRSVWWLCPHTPRLTLSDPVTPAPAIWSAPGAGRGLPVDKDICCFRS